MDVKHIRVGDVVKLKHGRGFLRVDEIVGTELRQRSDGVHGAGGGTVTWLDAELVEEVGQFVRKRLSLPKNNRLPHCGDCTWIGEEWACTMNCSGRTARGVKAMVMP